jgi:hypothetical protein
MSAGEAGRPTAATERLRRKNEAALMRLFTLGSRSTDDAAFVAALLESVADAAEHHAATNELPSSEREAWASVGARFDRRSVRRNETKLVDAFATLVADCVIGDAAMAKALGVDRSRVSQRLADRSLYAFAAADERCFPRWQVVNGKTLPGLREVLRSIDGEHHPLTVQHWFTTPNVDLEIDDQPVSPVAWLATGGAPQLAAQLAHDL